LGPREGGDPSSYCSYSASIHVPPQRTQRGPHPAPIGRIRLVELPQLTLQDILVHLAEWPRQVVAQVLALLLRDQAEQAACLRIVVLHAAEVVAARIADDRQFGFAVAHAQRTPAFRVDGRVVARRAPVGGGHRAVALLAGGLDPTVLVGGEVDAFGGTARVGRSPWVVAEACESDGTFLRYRPLWAVVTNVEPEHLEHYGGSFDRLLEAFARFLEGVRPEGGAVLCADDPRLRELAARMGPRAVTYGLDPQADFTFRDLERRDGETRFTALYRGRPLGTFTLRIPGLHNVANALAAVAVACRLGLPLDRVAEALADYRGARRRFEVVGQWGGVLVVDDYAHHPTEIRATLRAAREREPRRLIAVFQPHRYTRTYFLLEEFGRAFGDADEVWLTEVYSPPGERPIPGVSASALAQRIREAQGPPVRLYRDFGALVEALAARVQPGDLVLTMGAGDVWKVARSLAERLAAAREAAASQGPAS